MRTSTLAALVVAGGTLAALPFRRFSVDDEVEMPATGPTAASYSGLSPLRESPANADRSSKIDSAARRPSQVQLPAWQPERERRIEMPLTFDDLMLPIDRPAPIAEQFPSAEQFTSTKPAVPAVRHDRFRNDAASPPSAVPPTSLATEMASPVDAERLTADPAAKLSGEALRRRSVLRPSPVSGSVAASRSVESQDPAPEIPLAPKVTPRTRHWIRQPSSSSR